MALESPECLAPTDLQPYPRIGCLPFLFLNIRVIREIRGPVFRRIEVTRV